MKLSIIVPAHNEEDNIAEVIRQIEDRLDLDYELLVVNDHSVDDTAKCVNTLIKQYPNLRIVDNRHGKGFANAIRFGFEQSRGDMVVPVMADLCDDLSTIPLMMDKISNGYDLVCASRYIPGGRRLGGSRFKGFLSCFAGRSLYYVLGIPTHDIANAFKMYRKEVIQNIKIEAKGFEISMEIPLKAYYAGFRISEVPTQWKERTRGKSSFKVLKLLPDYLKLYIWAVFKRFFYAKG